jgi:hypothetical protein
MFRIINFKNLIHYFAVITTVISISIYEIAQRYWDNDIPLFKIVSIAPWISILILFFLSSHTTSRVVWWIVRKANKSIFPDLNGTWEGEIIFGENKSILAKAIIRQTLFQTWIDIHTETSKSSTLESTPTTEYGQCKLYYCYRSNPKNSDWPAYNGTTIFDVRRVINNSKEVLELSGQYFTDRGSKGRVRFRQISEDVHTDVSFY